MEILEILTCSENAQAYCDAFNFFFSLFALYLLPAYIVVFLVIALVSRS